MSLMPRGKWDPSCSFLLNKAEWEQTLRIEGKGCQAWSFNRTRKGHHFALTYCEPQLIYQFSILPFRQPHNNTPGEAESQEQVIYPLYLGCLTDPRHQEPGETETTGVTIQHILQDTPDISLSW